MSTTASLPGTKEAYDTLFQGIHERVFFAKCAAAGFAPRTRDEANWMLDTAFKLRQVSEAKQVKEAASQDNPFFKMNAALDKLMAEHGLDQYQKQAAFEAQEVGFRKAAAELANDPTFYNAVLSLKAAEAQQLKADFEASRKR